MSAPVRADDRGSAPPGYAEAINQALAELEANNLPEAQEEFRRAHAIFPNARTLRGMGMVEFELRNYSVSVRLLEAALASQVRPLEGKLLNETDTLLERARRYLGEVVVKLAPSSASLRVDGVKVRAAEPLRLEVGQHVLEADAPGYASERREIRINGEERGEIALTLRSLAVEPTVELPASERSVPADRSPGSEVQPAHRKWWVWTIVALVAAGGATAAALLLTREGKSGPNPVRSATTPPGVALQTLEQR